MSYKDMYDRIESLDTEIKVVKDDVATIIADISSIKTQVTNHLPHTLEDIKSGLKILDERIKPVETRMAKSSGVSEFLSLALKAITALAAATWTVIQIVRLF